MELNGDCAIKTDEESEFEKKLRLRLFQCETTITCNSFSKDSDKVGASSSTETVDETRIKGINSMDLSSDGNHLAVAVNCDSVGLIDLDSWTERLFPVKKYGISVIKFLSNNQAIHSSTRVNNELRIMDFDRPNEYVRYLRGHEGSVYNLDVAQNGKLVISSSADDRNVSLWDTSRVKPVAFIDIPVPDQPFSANQFASMSNGHSPRLVTSPRPVVAFDPTGFVFALASCESSGYLKLFDLRTFSRGPFLTFDLKISDYIRGCLDEDEDEKVLAGASCSLGADFTDVAFSPDARNILLNTDGPAFYILSALSGRIQCGIVRSRQTYEFSHFADNPVPPQVVFSPDSKHVLGGTGFDDGEIHVWNVADGSEMDPIKQIRPTRDKDFQVKFIAHHPSRMKIITCSTNNIDIYRPLHLNT